MNTQTNVREVDGESLPESEPVAVMRGDTGRRDSTKDEGTVKTASEPVASFTTKCSMTQKS